MCQRITRWSEINTGTFNLEGIHRLGALVEGVAAPLCDKKERVSLTPLHRVEENGELSSTNLGDAWLYRRRADAPRQVLLVVHIDTVFDKTHPFQHVSPTTLEDPELPGRRVMRGPGVSDAKGGLALLWTALEAFERARADDSTGWTVLLNPDEEIGSPGSAPLLEAEARRAELGLVFEPTLPDGQLAGARMGSANFDLVVRGRSAHVGRAFAEGRSAIHALATLISKITAWSATRSGVIANTGFVRGGSAPNVVADLAMARCNLRVRKASEMAEVEARLKAFSEEVGAADGVEITIRGGFSSPPKPLDDGTLAIFNALRRCGEDLGIPIGWRDTGGVCDGNKLAAAGLPNVDTLGPVGGNIHSEREYLDVDSLVPRAQLVASLLLRYAQGDLSLPRAREA